MKQVVFSRQRKLMWWIIGIAWSIVFLPIGLYAIFAPTSLTIFIIGILSVASSLFFLRLASYRYVVATDSDYIYFYHKGLFHKQIPWSEIESISMNRFSPTADLAITAGIVAGGSCRISQIYVHKKDGGVLSIPSLYFTLDNKRDLIKRLEDMRKSAVGSESSDQL